MRRLAVFLAAGLLGLVLLVVGSLTLVLSTEAGTGWALSRLLDQVNGMDEQQVTFSGSEGTLVSGLQLNSVEYQSDAARVSAARIGINWNPMSLMSARLSVPEISLNDVQVEIFGSDSPPEQDNQPPGPLISFTPLPVVIDLGGVHVSKLQIQQGEQQFIVDEISLSALLQNQSLVLSVIGIESETVSLAGDLSLVLNDNLPVAADLRWQFKQDVYADSGPAAGALALAGDLGNLELQHQLQQPVLLTSQGNVVTGLAGGDLNIELTHSSDSIQPPGLPVENLILNDFILSTTGGIESLDISLTTEGVSALTPPATLTLNANWQAGILSLQELQLSTETGQLRSSGQLSVGDTMTGMLQYQLSDASPLSYLENELPLEILNLRSSGVVEYTQSENTVQASLELTALSGEFGEYPFQGQGQIRYNDGTIQFDNVQLSTAANRLVASGVLSDQLDFSWEVNAPELNQFLENLGGELLASGQVTGTLADMELAADIEADSVSYNQLFVDHLQVNLQRSGQVIAGNVNISQAGLQGEERTDTVQSLVIQLEGTETQHQLALTAVSDYGDLELGLQGGFIDLSTFSWNGSLNQGRLNSDFGEWSADPENSIAFSNTSMNLVDNCWLQNGSSICLQINGETQPEGLSLQFNGQVSDYPLSVFNHPDLQADSPVTRLPAMPSLPEIVGVAGTLGADLSFQLAGDGVTTASVNLLPDDVFLTIRSVSQELDMEAGTDAETTADQQPPGEQVYALETQRLTATLQNGDWNLEAAATVNGLSTAAGTDPLNGTVDSRIQMAADGSLSGGLQADLGGIGWLEAFSQDIDNLEGSLTGAVELTGTVSEPRFGVDLQLADGGVTVLPLGITIEQITGNITSLDDGSIQLTTSAVSDNGTLELQGLVSDPFITQRNLQARIRGTDFRLADIPDLNLVVTPNITVNANEQKIEVAGSLHLPTMVITLVELPESAVDISRDAVIVDYPADQPELARSIASEQSTLFNVPVVADVNISLGEQVSFNGFGLTTEIAGSLNIRQQENGTNLTYGEVEIVRGQYSLYGRSLQVRQGKLLFFGAYDNPALDIRATREVETTTVGVLMNGTLKNIQSQLFSSPALPESDIIAILVTGKPFSEIGQGEGPDVVGAIANLGLSRSQGLTNQVREQLGLDTLAITNTGNINNSILTVGKYLTPDLFIRYGIGLFDHQSKLALDYTLTERITLQAETGEYQSVDVIYRVER